MNERTLARINSALKLRLEEEDRRVLTYIKGQISEKGIERRPEHDRNVTHLIEVAQQRLRKYEPKKEVV